MQSMASPVAQRSYLDESSLHSSANIQTLPRLNRQVQFNLDSNVVFPVSLERVLSSISKENTSLLERIQLKIPSFKPTFNVAEQFLKLRNIFTFPSELLCTKLNRSISIINKIQVSTSSPQYASKLESVGDFLASPGRIFLGRTYRIVEIPGGGYILKSTEKFTTFLTTLAKTAAVVLLPLSLISVLVGLGFKSLSHYIYPTTYEKYSIDTLINARIKENFFGKLPQNPLTRNCVNSQQKSRWGALYDVEPIAVNPATIEPLKKLKKILETTSLPNFDCTKMTLVEEMGPYLHYTYQVEIPSGPLKGIYIDDVDIYYSIAKSCFEIRSASRTGLVDRADFKFNLPGANKTRVEAIRTAWTNAMQ